MLGLGFAKLAAWVRTHSAQQTDYGEDLIGRVFGANPFSLTGLGYAA